MMAMDSQALVKLGPSIPETLGNFHLDDHNIVEWSDSNIPGLRHKARKETGKWINPVNNADIQYQKHEDCKQSSHGKEQTRTEVIQGQAPDSTFQIVRSRTQIHGSGNDNFSSRLQTSSTSYQMNSSKGVRSTSKSTSNRTKTVTVSGGRSTDDFEHLGLMFKPLDTSTQRERINVSRSGTMGVRRPPTRRHTPATPAPIVSTSPDDSEVEIKDEIIVDSDDNLRNSPELRSTKFSDHQHNNDTHTSLSIVGFKDISPKIRVGFPVEIQLELQSKLRNSAHLERNGGLRRDSNDDVNIYGHGMKDKSYQTVFTQPTETMEQFRKIANDSSHSLLDGNNRHRDSTFDFNQRRKSYESESIDAASDNYATKFSNPISYSNNNYIKSNETDRNYLSSRRSPSPVSKIWDRAPNVSNVQKESGNRALGLSSASVFKKFNLPYENNLYEKDIPIQVEKSPFKKTVVNVNTDEDSEIDTSKYFGNDNYMVTPFKLNYRDTYSNDETENLGYYVTDVKTPSPTPPSLERSRRLLEMLDETPTIMPFKSISENDTENEINNWTDYQGRDWETQRQLSFLNDSLSRILEGGINNASDEDTLQEEAIYSASLTRRVNDFDDSEADINGNFKGKVGQVSQTWISSGDEQKPSQKVRDNDVTTSISTTHDHLKRGQKKVEFCKTEVHFTADSGKFHIVETDENKPSTTHLFRKKKRDRSKQSILAALESINAKNKVETQNNEIAKIYSDEKSSSTNSGKLADAESEGHTTVDKQQWLYSRKDSDSSDNTETTSARMQTMESLKSSSTLYPLEKHNEAKSHSVNQLPNQSSPFLRQDDASTRILDVTHSNSFSSGDNNEQPPSHTILEEYEEMKIQRYLNHLKSPSQQHNDSSNPVFNFDPEDKSNSTYRFNNVLYENGSFVPLATRRSLIEMNNNNNKNSRVSESEKSGGDHTSNYSYSSDNSLNSSKPIRLARMEATVATARPNPQITSVELRYEFDNPRNDDQLFSPDGQKPETFEKFGLFSPSQPTQYHSLTSTRDTKLDQMCFRSPENKISAETPSYSSRAGRISDLIKRSYYKNPICDVGKSDDKAHHSSQKELSMSASTISSTNNNKGASKSIVTIGDYDSSRNILANNQPSSPEPMLSMDHTWKGPAYVQQGNNSSVSKNSQKVSSITLPKFKHNEPEWVSKARKRETQLTDWDAIGKPAVYSTPSQPEQPPWMEDIIRKPSYGDKTVPKVSVVYPWQRSAKSPEDLSLYSDNEGQSQIVSIVPPPPLYSLNNENESSRLNYSRGPKSLSDLPVLEPQKDVVDKDFGSLDLVHSTTTASLRNEGKAKAVKTKRSLPEFPPNTTSFSLSPSKLKNEAEKQNKLQDGHKSPVVGLTTVGRKTQTVTKQGKDSIKPPILTPIKESTHRSGRSGGGSSSDQKYAKTQDPYPKREKTVSSISRAGKKIEDDSSGSQNKVTIHRHPLVKVSKLPIRNKPPPKAVEGRLSVGSKGLKIRSKENQTDESDKLSAKKKTTPTLGGPKTESGSSSVPGKSNTERQAWRRK